MAKNFQTGFKLSVTEEVARQHEIVNNEMAKLTDMSRRGWHLIEHGCYKREMASSALIGGTCVVAAIGLTKLVKKIREKRKNQKETEDK